MKDYGDYSTTPLEDKIMEEVTEEENSGQKETKQNLKSENIHFPTSLNKAALYGIAGEFVSLIEPHTEADPVALLINLLTGFGNIIGDSSFFKVEAAKHPMRIFAILVGESSRGRKGTSWDYVKNILRSIDETLQFNAGLSSGEGLINAVRDEIIKQQYDKKTKEIEPIVVDEGVKDKRLLVIEQEFSATLKVLNREGNILSAIIRGAWDTGDLQTLTKNNPVKATGAHISIIGHITREELLRYLTSTESSNGFGNRFLWVCVKRSKELPSGGNLKESDLEEVISKLRQAVQYAKNLSGEVKWTLETKILWAKIYHDLTTDTSGIIGSLTARSEAYVCRLASIYALLDQSNEIKIEHIKAALAVWDYVYASITYIFQGKTGDPLANKIIEALTLNQGGMTRTDIINNFKRNIDSEQLSISIESLLNLNRIKREVINTVGRPKELFSLNSFNSYPHSKKTYLEIFENYIAEYSNEDEKNNP